MQTKLKISFLLALLITGFLSQGQNSQSAAAPTKTNEQLQKENEQLLRTKNDWPNFGRYRDANEKLG